MKRFVFPLDRVLRFRRLEMERVEARLTELAFRAHNERRTAEQRRAEALQSGQQLAAHRELRGNDFQAARHWLDRLAAERDQALAASEKLLQQHRQVLCELVEARRKVKLLETLRGRKLDAHTLETAKQFETQASEFFLAKRTREGHHG
jgi:hypothetical protein